MLDELSESDAGEVLTLQRAAYVTEAQAHGDLTTPPLVQSLDELTRELTAPGVLALGLREEGRLVAAVRVRIGHSALVMMQESWDGWSSHRTDRDMASAVGYCTRPKNSFFNAFGCCDCSPANTVWPTSACTPATATSRPTGVQPVTTSWCT